MTTKLGPSMLVVVLALGAAACGSKGSSATSGSGGSPGAGSGGAGGSGGSATGSGGATGTGGSTGSGGGGAEDAGPRDAITVDDAGEDCPMTEPLNMACRVSQAGRFCDYGEEMCVCIGTGASSALWNCFKQGTSDDAGVDAPVGPVCPATEPSGTCDPATAAPFCVYGAGRMCICMGGANTWLCFGQGNPDAGGGGTDARVDAAADARVDTNTPMDAGRDRRFGGP